ncbi:hypothetical protein [Stenomitos frigidus]|uniref:Uncharacterized protein n=1 Tax=Stenomitos frigidus ULC18 TaxID=2107698 RepID=A0A2T1E0D6_9CYAN|nr:hypothetical protein [Stenomitos frigidus]PSB26218.1 hypothetical protein C7B82_20585 [Stenomitos frigidus ULC18]
MAKRNAYVDLDLNGSQLTAGLVRSPSVSHVVVRQCVLNGSYDSNGQPNALGAGSGLSVVLAASSSTPFTLAFAAGYDAYGCLDYVGQFTSSQTISGLTANATQLFIYVDRNPSTGALTFGFTTQGYIYQFKQTIASPAATFHWFDLTTFTMKTYTGSAFVPVQRVIIGEVATNATSVTNVITYAYRGHFASNWIAVAANTVYTVNHNLGVQLASASGNLQFWTSATGSEGDAVLATPSVYFNAKYYGYQTNNAVSAAWKLLQFATKDFVLLDTSNNWQTTGYYQVRMTRGW